MQDLENFVPINFQKDLTNIYKLRLSVTPVISYVLPPESEAIYLWPPFTKEHKK